MAASCPHCHERVDCHMAADGSDAQPRKGDVALCNACNSISIFTADGGLRVATASEMEEILRNAKFRRAIRQRDDVIGLLNRARRR